MDRLPTPHRGPREGDIVHPAGEVGEGGLAGGHADGAGILRSKSPGGGGPEPVLAGGKALTQPSDHRYRWNPQARTAFRILFFIPIAILDS